MTGIDKRSFRLGMINCFCEMVAMGVKRLAISPPLAPKDYQDIRVASQAVVEGSGIRSYLEKSLLITALQSADFTRDKWSILYYKDEETLEAYLALKERQQNLEAEGRYTDDAHRAISTEFMQLLSYPDEVIAAKLWGRGESDPFMLVTDPDGS